VSSVPICAAHAPRTIERRAHPRRRMEQLAYIGFGPNSGGVLLDVSEGGLRCQIVGAVVEGDRCHLKFALPGRRSAIESDGQVVWSNRSKQGGGVRLLGLAEDVRHQLQQWIGGDAPSAAGSVPIPTPVPAETVAAVHPLPSRTASAVVVPARETPATQPPTSTPGPPQPLAQLHAQPQRPLAIAPVQKRNLRAMGIAAVAGCMVLGVAALAFSNISLKRVTGLFRGEFRSGIAAPATVTTAVPVAGMSDASSQAGVLHERATPLSSAAAGDVFPITSQPARPEVPISKSVPATSDRPVQRPPAAVTNNRQRLAMALPRPRMANPRPPVAALPAPAAGELVAPPIALIDPQPFETRLPDLPQPVRPQSGTVYLQPELVLRVEPVYSRFARDARLQGTVQISAAIGNDGLPRSLARVSGNAALADMAIEAVRQWRYHPALLNGQPTEAHTVITFNFRLR